MAILPNCWTTEQLLNVESRDFAGLRVLAEVCKEHFRRVWHFDFQSKPELSEVFKKGLTPTTILESLEVHFEASIDIEKDLIFFDEVGDCQPALDSLKYFSELLPDAFVCASGSNIGLLKSFPVGKVEMLSVFHCALRNS